MRLAYLFLLSVMICISHNLLAQETNYNLDLSADDIIYSEDGATVTAHGNVKIVSEMGSVWADELTYNTEDGRVKASGNIVYIDQNKMTAFMENLEISGDFKNAILHNLKIDINAGATTPTLKATRAERSDGYELALYDVNYSPCRTCESQTDDELPWKIRADYVKYNEEKGFASYKDAYLDVYGHTAFYFPYFRHPVKEVPLNGLLPPRFGNSTTRGFEVIGGYYHRINDDQDTTFRLRTMTRRGTQLQAEHRAATHNFFSTIRASGIDDDLTNSFRGHVEAQTEYTFSPGRRIGLRAETPSDDTYMYDFFDRNEAYFSTQLYAEDAGLDHYFGFAATHYQDVEELKDSATTPHAFPSITAHKILRLDNEKQSVHLNANMMSLSRKEGTTTHRLATEALFQDKRIASGNHLTLQAKLRADGYYIDTDSTTTSENIEGSQGRVIPEIAYTIERPYVSEGGSHKITPRVMTILSPRGGNPSEIPNEDSTSYELDSTNLFSTRRFSGYDRVETGPRVVYGVDNHFGKNGRVDWRLFLGQSLRFFNDQSLPNASGTHNKQSDFVGFISGSPAPWFKLNSNFRLNNSDLEAKMMSNQLEFGDINDSHLLITHVMVEDGPEEIRARGEYRFNDRYSFEGEVRRDLTDNGKQLLSQGSIVMHEECYRFSFRARRNGFDNRNVPPSTEYTFNIELLTWGREN